MAGEVCESVFCFILKSKSPNFSRGIETIWRSYVLYMYACTAHAVYMLYSTLTYRNGVSIVSLFISTGRLAMPDFDEWSRQWAHAFLVVRMKNIISKRDKY